MKRTTFIASLFALALITLSGCAVTDVHRSQQLDANARWALLPIANYAETPQAGERAEAILTTLLHQQGVSQLTPAPRTNNGGLPEFDQAAALDQAVTWARNQGYRYGVTGAVEEWQYKTGLDGEPAVGISLRVIDVNTGATVWSASGSKAGWGYATVSGTAQQLMSGLVGDMPL
ncbi:hypothetical protein J7355_17510 [Endozoicomonas sp. G2_2]|uniref:hypothetical protein n=1 Tax=Endozoicomonas sp. G2_2 TaxID=2821092 RepID=UPI001ADA16C2|nr:hypothetical protein [Endozoicomonas sp. G2_2]MBO9471893.1 hypothetical protein [Endozoicomonas sp. G2_2]